MKTTINITALAVITFFTMLACAPEATLTSRDFSEIRDGKNPIYSDSSSYAPSVTVGSRPTYIAPPAVTPDAQKELSFDFPIIADIFLEDRASTANLKNFMSMYTFSNGSSGYTELSVKENDVDFEFARRSRNAASSETETVIIKLSIVPNKTFVVKIDATAYTFARGNKLDANNDGIAGEAYYDDLYFTITPNNASNTSIYTHPGSLNFQLDIKVGFDGSNNANTLVAQNIIVADLDLGAYNSANKKEQQGIILEAIKDLNRIKLQKYDSKTRSWADTGMAIRLEDTNPNTTMGEKHLVASITPQDGGIYRTYASGMRNLTTAVEFLGIKQKIKVLGGDAYGTPTATYKDDVVISNPVFFWNQYRRLQTITPVDSAIPIRVMSDAAGKNVKLEIFFKGIDVSVAATTTTYWLKELDFGTFNNCFKLAYVPANPNSDITLSAATKLDDIVFIPIKNVAYSAENTGNYTQSDTNKITVTLDPSYQISKERNRAINLLLSPEFQYGNDLITFGDYSSEGTRTIINGTAFWRSYGRIPNGGATVYLYL